MRSKFHLDLSGSKDTCFGVSRREKHDGDRIVALTFFVQKLFTKEIIQLLEVVDLTSEAKVDLMSY